MTATTNTKDTFIIVGENIHCTRVRLTSGKFVETDADGRSAILCREGKETVRLPVPQSVVDGDGWKSGKVRHVAVAIQQGMYGNDTERDLGRRYLQAMATDQQENGAWFLDVNVDEFSVDRDEKIRAMEWAVDAIQQVVKVPLSIDSSDPQILEAGLAACDASLGKPMVNSVSLERAALIPIAAAAHACVIAGATGEERMPETLDARLVNIEALMKKIEAEGFSAGDLFLDPLVYPVSVDVQNAGTVIDSIRALRERYGADIHFAPGLSNVSYGLPKRGVINQVFAQLCADAGCDGGIVDPAQINSRVLASIDYTVEAYRLARELLLGNDEFGMNYIMAVKEGRA